MMEPCIRSHSNIGQSHFLPKWVLVLLVLFLVVPQMLHAYSEELELAIARGEYLYQKNEIADAEDYFDLCLQIDPAHGRANQYRGLCALSGERYEEAEGYLKKALETEPDNPEVAFDLARVYASSGNGEQATGLIQALPESVRSRPLVRYFEGVALVSAGRYEESIPVLEDVAQIDQPEAIRAVFYLGLAQEKIGQKTMALEAYNRVMATSNDARLVSEAHRRVRRMKQLEKLAKRWSAAGGIGIYYNDNIALEPDSFDVTDEQGWVARLFANGLFYPYKSSRGSVKVGGGMRYHVLVAGEEDLRDFDMIRMTARASTRWLLFRSRVAGYLGLGAQYDYTMLDQEGYSQRVAAKPFFDLYESKWTATRLTYRFTYRAFPDDSKRDGMEHDGGLTQYFFLPDREGFVELSAKGVANTTDSDFYNYYGLLGEVALDMKVVWQLFVQFMAEYEYRDYYDHPIDRIDRRLNLYGGLYVQPLPWLRIIADYRFTDNDSKSRYDYNRDIMGLSVEFRH